MDCHATPVTNRYARKRQRDPANWKTNLAKRQRYSSKAMPVRVCEHDTKALQCCKVTMAQMNHLHRKFYAHQEKKYQDALILKYCSIEPVKPRAGFKGKKQSITKFFMLKTGG